MAEKVRSKLNSAESVNSAPRLYFRGQNGLRGGFIFNSDDSDGVFRLASFLRNTCLKPFKSPIHQVGDQKGRSR